MSKAKIKTACVQMTGPDVKMDLLGGGYYDLANLLPIKCAHCTFPNLDFIAKPYLLTKGFSSPAETSLACVGNFLVRERVKRILELAVPDACTFYPTAERKSKKPTTWWVAVPRSKLNMPSEELRLPVCSVCGEPKTWYYKSSTFADEMKSFDSGGKDLFKSTEWTSRPGTIEDAYEEANACRKQTGDVPLTWSELGVTPPSHPERWTRIGLSPDLFFSIRLEQLFKRAKVKGQLVRYYDFREFKPSPEDEVWIKEKLELLSEHGLVDGAKPTKGKVAGAAQKWFKDYLKKNAKKGIKAVDFAAVEKKQKLALSQDYKDFIATVGAKPFKDVNRMEGSTTTVLLPQKLDFKDYRSGKVAHLEGEDSEVDGVVFAEMDSGDVFVFDVRGSGGNWPVYFYNHEENSMEQFASSFAECIQRFAKGN